MEIWKIGIRILLGKWTTFFLLPSFKFNKFLFQFKVWTEKWTKKESPIPNALKILSEFPSSIITNFQISLNLQRRFHSKSRLIDSRFFLWAFSMASLLKFKLLPTHCGVAQSPTLSPRTSPLVHLRRRKTTLRMLLTLNSGRRSPRRRALPEKKRDDHKDFSRSNTLKDLFVSSPPYVGTDGDVHETTVAAPSRNVTPVCKEKEYGEVGSAGWNPGSPRPGWTGFRYKYLLRKTWRPVLAGIPE